LTDILNSLDVHFIPCFSTSTLSDRIIRMMVKTDGRGEHLIKEHEPQWWGWREWRG
jgi:hypothetical protein